MTSDPADAKRALRAELRERRQIMTSSERERSAQALTAQLIELAESTRARSVAAYLSTNHEPSTRGFLDWAQQQGIRVILPISRDDGLLDWAPYDGAVEDVDVLGMPTPTSQILGPFALDEVDLIIVPAAAVDEGGMRMGWGRGYFDRALGSIVNCPPVYAVVFDHEVLPEVPRERHDEPIDGVVTPAGTRRLGAS